VRDALRARLRVDPARLHPEHLPHFVGVEKTRGGSVMNTAPCADVFIAFIALLGVCALVVLSGYVLGRRLGGDIGGRVLLRW
jgi:hypothetical protein